MNDKIKIIKGVFKGVVDISDEVFKDKIISLEGKEIELSIYLNDVFRDFQFDDAVEFTFNTYKDDNLFPLAFVKKALLKRFKD